MFQYNKECKTKQGDIVTPITKQGTIIVCIDKFGRTVYRRLEDFNFDAEEETTKTIEPIPIPVEIPEVVEPIMPVIPIEEIKPEIKIEPISVTEKIEQIKTLDETLYDEIQIINKGIFSKKGKDTNEDYL